MKDRALLVDPMGLLPEPLLAFLSSKGFEVDKVTAEAQSIKLMAEHHYSLIFVCMQESEMELQY